MMMMIIVFFFLFTAAELEAIIIAASAAAALRLSDDVVCALMPFLKSGVYGGLFETGILILRHEAAQLFAATTSHFKQLKKK